MRRLYEIKSFCVALNWSLNDCRVHLCSTHSFALESLVGALSPHFHGGSVRTGPHPSGKASVPSHSDHSLNSQMGESLIALTHPPGLSVVSHQQGGLPSSRCWERDMIRIIWFKNEMRMGELCCQSDAEGRQQRAEGNCNPVHGITKEIHPRAMHGLMAGNWGDVTDLHNSLDRKKHLI